MPGLIIAGDSVVLGGGGGSGGPTIQLSGTQSVAENAALGTPLAGSLSVNGGTGTYTFSIIFDSQNVVALDVDGVTPITDGSLTGLTSFQYTVHANNGAGSILDRTFTETVTAAGGSVALKADFANTPTSEALVFA